MEIAARNNLSPEDLENLLKEKAISQLEENVWTPEFEPESVQGNISEIEPGKIPTLDLSNQNPSAEGENETDTPSNNDDTSEDGDDKSKTPDRQSIGKWGEEFVFHSLKIKYRNETFQETETGFTFTRFPDDLFEIIWLNKNGNRGKGYDFVIKKNGIEIEYIEVKTKTVDGDELIKVTGTQWDFARKLFEQNKGDKYCFYLVQNAGEENAEIKILRNPIKLWKEGKLHAHPINFKL